jgi:hypothetical protein
MILRKLSLLTLALVAIFLTQCSLFKNTSKSTESFEGKVEYEFKVDGGQMAKRLSTMMPNQLAYNFAGPDMMMELKGGMMANRLGKIVVKDNGKNIYMIQDDKKKVIKIKSPEEEEDKGEVKKTKETAEIQGYTCQKYTRTTNRNGQEVTMDLWVTKDIYSKTFSALPASIPFVQTMPDKIDGFPLKTVSHLKMRGQEVNITVLANKIVKEAPAAENFQIPEDYEMKEKKASELMKMGR